MFFGFLKIFRLFLYIYLLKVVPLLGAITFEQDVLYLSVIHNSKSNIPFKFTFKNTASHSIKIEQIVSACKCVSVSSDKKVYKSGNGGCIYGFINIEGLFGETEKIIKVYTNDLSNGVINLSVKLNVITPITVTPKLLLWRKDEKIVKKTTTITFIDDSYSMDSNITKNDNYLLEIEKATSKKYYIHITPTSTQSPQKYKIPLKIQTLEGIVYRDIFMLVR